MHCEFTFRFAREFKIFFEVSPYLQSFRLVSPFILGVHCDESQHQQIEGGGDDGQAEQNENQGEHHVLGFVVQRVILLQRDHVAESDGRQSDKAIVDGIEIRPPFVPGERCGTSRNC